MPTTKAISLWQPWASLIVWGEKRYETRSWDTRYRGLVAIHAAKRWTVHEKAALFNLGRVFPSLQLYVPDLRGSPLPLGAMLCVCRLIETYRTEDIRYKLTPQEQAFGNYTRGRYAWKLDIVEIFDEPIPARGAQGLFDWEWKR